MAAAVAGERAATIDSAAMPGSAFVGVPGAAVARGEDVRMPPPSPKAAEEFDRWCVRRCRRGRLRSGTLGNGVGGSLCDAPLPTPAPEARAETAEDPCNVVIVLGEEACRPC